MPPGAPHLTTRPRFAGDAARGGAGRRSPISSVTPREPGGLTAMDAQLALNFLKVEASELAVQTVMSAMRACGLSGYRNDTRVHHRPLAARHPVGADHDQQRPHPRQRRSRGADERAAAAR